jgi:predicted MFS family arabinose efflux permease
VFLVIFIDGMGLSLVIPILNNIIINPLSAFVPHSLSSEARMITYGAVVGVFMFCWFFGATILGDMSDKIGRKRALTICLTGAFIGYALSAFAILIHSLSILILGRIIAGFTAGSQPIAQAAIIDNSNQSNLVRNIGFIILSVSLGFAFGPFIGGVLSNPNIISWFNFTTPMIFASIISLLNILFLKAAYHEKHIPKDKIQIHLHHAISIFLSAFKSKRIRYLAITFFIFIIGWSSYFTFISAYMIHRFHISTFNVSMYFMVMGLGFILGCTFFVGYFTKRFSPKYVCTIATALTSIFVFLILMSTKSYQPWILTFCIGASMSTAYSVILAIFSGQVNDHEQGWVMGVTGSIMALCFGITAIAASIISSSGNMSQLILSGTGLGIAAILMLLFKPA